MRWVKARFLGCVFLFHLMLYKIYTSCTCPEKKNDWIQKRRSVYFSLSVFYFTEKSVSVYTSLCRQTRPRWAIRCSYFFFVHIPSSNIDEIGYVNEKTFWKSKPGFRIFFIISYLIAVILQERPLWKWLKPRICVVNISKIKKTKVLRFNKMWTPCKISCLCQRHSVTLLSIMSLWLPVDIYLWLE